MAATSYLITLSSNATGSTFTRTVKANEVRALRLRAENEGFTIRSSRPVRSA